MGERKREKIVDRHGRELDEITEMAAYYPNAEPQSWIKKGGQKMNEEEKDRHSRDIEDFTELNHDLDGVKPEKRRREK